MAGTAAGLHISRSALADCTGSIITTGMLSRFAARIAGSVILPSDANYSSSRLLYNRRFNPFPVMIVRALGESDVARTIEFARVNQIQLAVRSGGHSYIGASGCSGIVLDLSQMSAISSIGGANFRIGSGARLDEMYGALRCGGGWTLPCGSCESVGFGGIAQGGGFGLLQRSHGLTIDRVRGARVVLADGTAVNADANGDSDLHWAIRGAGGGSLGVVTHFDVEAVQYQPIHVIGWYWPIAAADEALGRFVALQQSGAVPNSATVALLFDTVGASVTPAQCRCVLFSTGSVAEAQATKQLYVGAGGIPETPGFGYEYDAASPACDPQHTPSNAYYRAKSAMVYGTPSADTGSVLRTWLASRLSDSRLSVQDYATVTFLTLGGRVGETAPTATAFPHRDALLEAQFLGYVQYQSDQAIAANTEWIRGVYADTFTRLSVEGAGCYVNYCDDDLTESQWPNLYWGGNYPRLQATKLRVDPDDFFHGKQTIRIP